MDQAKAEKLYLGNFITVESDQPFAKALTVVDGKIQYVGCIDKAKTFCDESTEIIDFGDKYIYPGFMDSHTHGLFAGYRAIGQADLFQVFPTDYDAYRKIIKEFIAKNPQKQIYLAAGWCENEEKVTSQYLDDICSDKPLIMNTAGGHSCLLNTKALEWAHIDADYAKKMGYDQVHVDKNGNPNGYICETPAVELFSKLPITEAEAKSYILHWQDFMLKNGFTAAGDAGAELVYKHAPKIYHKLEEEGKLKTRTYSYHLVADNAADPEAQVDRVAQEKEKYSKEYYQVVGIKAFLDGVIEAHTGWLVEDYDDQPGYHGVERFNDKEKMVALISSAQGKNLSVHVHSEGDGATKFMLECIKESQKITGNKDQRNVLAHLHIVKPEDIEAMAETASIPAVAPLWTPKYIGEYDNELTYIGKDRAEAAYPIKSFFDAGAHPVFHTDYPISPSFDIALSFYMAQLRAVQEEELGGIKTQRNAAEAINRQQSLEAMTINVAYMWHEEDRLGSLVEGKIANMTVMDCDLLNEDIEKITSAKIVATIVDGEIAYKA